MLVDASGGVIAQEGLPVPPPWDVRESSKYTGRFYFFNTINGESKWSLPPSLLLEAKHAVVISANSRASTSVSSDTGNGSTHNAKNNSNTVPEVAEVVVQPHRKKATAKSSALAERLAAWEQTTAPGTSNSPVRNNTLHGSRGRSAPPRSPGRFSNRSPGQPELSTPERLRLTRERQIAKPSSSGDDSYKHTNIKEEREMPMQKAPISRGRAHSVATRRFQWPPAPPNLKTSSQQGSPTAVQSPSLAPQDVQRATQSPSQQIYDLSSDMTHKKIFEDLHESVPPQLPSPPKAPMHTSSSPIAAAEVAALEVPRGRGRTTEVRGRASESSGNRTGTKASLKDATLTSASTTTVSGIARRPEEDEVRGGRGSSVDAARRSAFGLLPSPSSSSSSTTKRNFKVVRSQSTAAPRPRQSVANQEEAVSPAVIPQRPSALSPYASPVQTLRSTRDSPSIPSEHGASNVPTAFRKSSPVPSDATLIAPSKGKPTLVVAASGNARVYSSQPTSPQTGTPSQPETSSSELSQSSSPANETNAYNQHISSTMESPSSVRGTRNSSSSSGRNSEAAGTSQRFAQGSSHRDKDHKGNVSGLVSPEERRASLSLGRSTAAPSLNKFDQSLRGSSIERPPTSPSGQSRSAFGLIAPNKHYCGQVYDAKGGDAATATSGPQRLEEGASITTEAVSASTEDRPTPKAVTSASKALGTSFSGGSLENVGDRKWSILPESPTKLAHDPVLSMQSPSTSRTISQQQSLSGYFFEQLRMKGSGSLSPLESFDPSSLEVVGGLGQGTFACVVAVQTTSTKQASEKPKHFAMKVIAKSGIARHRDRERLEFELRAMTEVPFSPFLQRCRAAFESVTDIFFVVDLASGGDLFYHLASKIKEGGGGFTEAEGRTLLSEVVLGLDHLHNHGFVHRDVKVENVILDHSGHVKLVDFGLACALNEPATIATGSAGVGASAASALAAAGQTDAKNNSNCWEEPMALTGSLIYMAPELLERQRGGRQTDWWAVGVLAHEILTGRSPWSSLNDKQIIRREICSLPVLPPAGLSRSCGHFVCSLLRQDYRHRLGTRSNNELVAHPFFKTVDWLALREGRGPPVLPSSFDEGSSSSNSDVVSCVASASAGDRALALAAYLMKGSSTIKEKQTKGPGSNKVPGQVWYLGLDVVQKHPEVASGAVAKAAAEASAEEAETEANGKGTS